MDIIIVILSAMALLFYYYHNQNRKIERFYYKHSKLLFGVLEIICFIIMTSFVFNSRYIIYKYVHKYIKLN
jgi:DMSO/TMAO reductase YedYZ heme-binding membrane subunit